MRTTRETGNLGESAVASLLERRGWKIAAQNYAVSGSELDIVAYRRGVLAFVEVKTRSGSLFGTPAEAVNTAKRYRLRAAAMGFWREQSRHGMLPVWSRLRRDFTLRGVREARLDIAEVYLKNGVVERVNIIENAESYDWLLNKKTSE